MHDDYIDTHHCPVCHTLGGIADAWQAVTANYGLVVRARWRCPQGHIWYTQTLRATPDCRRDLHRFITVQEAQEGV